MHWDVIVSFLFKISIRLSHFRRGEACACFVFAQCAKALARASLGRAVASMQPTWREKRGIGAAAFCSSARSGLSGPPVRFTLLDLC